MKKVLTKYLQKLVKTEADLHFVSAVCNYGKFTIYCLIGPEENIIHLTFAPRKHERAQKQLEALDDNIVFRSLEQTSFCYDAVFKDYFTGKLTKFPITAASPFIDAGTPFQQRVWQHISAVPYGNCITYQKLAELAGSRKAARAAGMACGANPLALIVPCHRVVAHDGLGGFAGGLNVKKALLTLEQSQCNCMQRSITKSLLP